MKCNCNHKTPPALRATSPIRALRAAEEDIARSPISLISQPLPANTNRYRQMSSPVSPRQRDIGEVASLRAEGVDRQPRSGVPASRETEKLRSCNVASCRTLRLRHLPYPRSARQRRTLLRTHFQQLTTTRSQKTHAYPHTSQRIILQRSTLIVNNQSYVL